MSLRLLVWWDWGFDSRRGHGCLSLVSVVYCQIEASVTGRSHVKRTPTKCDMSNECDREPHTGRLRSGIGSERHRKTKLEEDRKTKILINGKKHLPGVISS